MSKLIPALLLFLSVNVATAAPSKSDSAQGTWEGVWRKQGDALTIRVELFHDDSGWHGSFGSADLGVLDILFHNVQSVGEQVSFDAVGDFTTTHFKGTVAGDDLSGSLEESPNTPSPTETPTKGTFELHRSNSVGRPYNIRPATFKNGNVQLAGSLLIPKTEGRHPAIILVAGSLAQPRGAMMFIADDLARKGIVALVYDKRGVGDSTGDWKSCSNEDLAQDASAGIDLLASLPEVDPAKVGIYGHSQGGIISPFVAVHNPRVKFLVAAGTFGGFQYEQDLARVGALIPKAGFSPADQKLALNTYKRFVAIARDGDPRKRSAFLSDMKAYAGKDWFEWLGIPEENSFWWAFYPKIANFNPMPLWPKVSVPIMLIQGEQDFTCPVHPGLDREVACLQSAGAKNVTVKIFPNADHTLRLVPKPGQVWPHIAPGFLDTLSSWILAR